MQTSRKLLSNFPPGPLDRYRKQASFDWKKMKIFLEGIEMIEFNDKLIETFQDILLFQQPVGPLTFDETRQLSAKRCHILRHLNLLSVEHALSDTRKPGVVLRNLFYWDPSSTIKMSISYGMFVNVIRSLGTDRHYEYILEALDGNILGCFCLTEIGHGTNTKAMRTIATYDPLSEEFILHSPDFQAAKCWAGSLGIGATHAIVYAQLYTPDKICHGLHPFIVSIRDRKTLKPFAGITVGDMGEKAGLNGIDNGFLMFDNFRIPRICLLNKTADVRPEGTYITPLKDPSKRFGLALGALSSGRVNITHICTSYLIKAISIALRYAAVRKQFGPENQAELPVLEYQVHQWRLIPYLAAAYVFQIFSDFFTSTVIQFTIDSFTGNNVDIADLGMEIHVASSAAKPVISWISRDGIQECREACGGHGYLKVSGLGDIRNDHDANCTYEGENHVLIQQTSNWLLKLWPLIIKYQPLPKMPLQSMDYLSNALIILETKFKASTVDEAVSPENILNAYKWLVSFLLKQTAEKQNDLLNKGLDSFTVKNEIQVFYARTLGIVYIEHFILDKTLQKINQSEDTSLKKVLTKLISLYGAWSLDKHMSILYQGYANGPELADLIKQGILRLCTELKTDAVSLIDVIAPHDFLMTSPLGQSDGEIYKNLQSAIFNTPGSMARPSWWTDIVDWKSYITQNIQSKL